MGSKTQWKKFHENSAASVTKESMEYCVRDYKHRHSWSRIGIEGGTIFYQCSQCRKCSWAPIIIIGRLL